MAFAAGLNSYIPLLPHVGDDVPTTEAAHTDQAYYESAASQNLHVAASNIVTSQEDFKQQAALLGADNPGRIVAARERRDGFHNNVHRVLLRRENVPHAQVNRLPAAHRTGVMTLSTEMSIAVPNRNMETASPAQREGFRTLLITGVRNAVSRLSHRALDYYMHEHPGVDGHATLYVQTSIWGYRVQRDDLDGAAELGRISSGMYAFPWNSFFAAGVGGTTVNLGAQAPGYSSNYYSVRRSHDPTTFQNMVEQLVNTHIMERATQGSDTSTVFLLPPQTTVAITCVLALPEQMAPAVVTIDPAAYADQVPEITAEMKGEHLPDAEDAIDFGHVDEPDYYGDGGAEGDMVVPPGPAADVDAPLGEFVAEGEMYIPADEPQEIFGGYNLRPRNRPPPVAAASRPIRKRSSRYVPVREPIETRSRARAAAEGRKSTRKSRRPHRKGLGDGGEIDHELADDQSVGEEKREIPPAEVQEEKLLAIQRKRSLNMIERLLNQYSVFKKVKPDGYCLPRCYAVWCAMNALQMKYVPEGVDRANWEAAEKVYKKITSSNSTEQRNMAHMIAETENLPRVEEEVDGEMVLKGFAVPESYEMIAKAKNVRIVVFRLPKCLAKDRYRPYQTTYPKGPNTRSMSYMYLTDDGGHVTLLLKPEKLFGCNHWCNICMKGYNHSPLRHPCYQEQCRMCGEDHLPLKPGDRILHTLTEQYCADCQRNFTTERCKLLHKQIGMCAKTFYCPVCQKDFTTTKKHNKHTHRCNQKRCRRCHANYFVHEGHDCCIAREKTKTVNDQIVAFDFETTVAHEEEERKHQGLEHMQPRMESCPHKVNHAQAMYVYPRPNQPQEPLVFNTLEEFGDWVFTAEHVGYTFIAHNGRGFDFCFILQYMLSKGLCPSLVNNGLKLMQVDYPPLKISFKDTLNFVQIGLAEFPKTFGIKELKKGFFPHAFNTPQNQNYDGPLPHRDYYHPEQMSRKKLVEFDKWYAEQQAQDVTFNFKKEMQEYCESDVRLLAEGIRCLRKEFLAEYKIDPFRYMTIAQTCMAIYRSLFMPEQSIACMSFADSEFCRRAFYGGRTEAYKLHYRFEDGIQGQYDDVCSLYPTVNYYAEYPVGQPKWITPDTPGFTKWEDYRGVVECDIDPPDDLYHPVLPYRDVKSGKLVFALIPIRRQCYCSIELMKAVEKGYKIRHVYRILYWDQWTNQLFREYVRTGIRGKQEASGWPESAQTPEQKQHYLDEFEEKQGVKLRPDQINKNPGKRSMCKMILNSLWGKFGQKSERTGVTYAQNTKDVQKLFRDQKLEVKQCEVVNENFVLFTHSKTQSAMVENPQTITNLAIAAYTTAYARLELYKALEFLGERVLYCDTDSVVYYTDTNNPEHQNLRRGTYLGDWVPEMRDGEYLVGDFVSGGPKNYAYETNMGDKKVRIKGIMMTAANAARFTAEAMKDVITGARENIETAPTHMMKRTKLERNIVSQMFKKMYKNTYTKRRIRTETKRDGFIDTEPLKTLSDDMEVEDEEQEWLEAKLGDLEISAGVGDDEHYDLFLCNLDDRVEESDEELESSDKENEFPPSRFPPIVLMDVDK